jgi:hypothetical protein
VSKSGDYGENQYQTLQKRVETWMEIVWKDTPASNPNFVELDILADGNLILA